MKHSGEPRVFVDTTHLGRRVTGIERVTVQILDALQGRVPLVTRSPRGRLAMLAEQNLILPWILASRAIRAGIFPGFPPALLCSLTSPGRIWLYVHDLFLIERPGDLSRLGRFYLRPLFRLALRRARILLCNSETTRAAIERHTGRQDAVLLRPAILDVFRAAGTGRCGSAGPGSTILCIGTVEPRKNYPYLLRAVERLVKAGLDVRLIILGRQGWGDDWERLAASPLVTLRGYVSEDEARQAILAADLFVSTSKDEGLGLPLLEVQYFDLPLLVSDIPAFREVLGQSGRYLPLDDEAGAADSLSAMLIHPRGEDGGATNAANLRRWNALAAADMDRFVRMLRG